MQNPRLFTEGSRKRKRKWKSGNALIFVYAAFYGKRLISNFRPTHRWTVRLEGLVVTGVTDDNMWIETVTSKVGSRHQTKQSSSNRETLVCVCVCVCVCACVLCVCRLVRELVSDLQKHRPQLCVRASVRVCVVKRTSALKALIQETYPHVLSWFTQPQVQAHLEGKIDLPTQDFLDPSPEEQKVQELHSAAKYQAEIKAGEGGVTENHQPLP